VKAQAVPEEGEPQPDAERPHQDRGQRQQQAQQRQRALAAQRRGDGPLHAPQQRRGQPGGPQDHATGAERQRPAWVGRIRRQERSGNCHCRQQRQRRDESQGRAAAHGVQLDREVQGQDHQHTAQHRQRQRRDHRADPASCQQIKESGGDGRQHGQQERHRAGRFALFPPRHDQRRRDQRHQSYQPAQPELHGEIHDRKTGQDNRNRTLDAAGKGSAARRERLPGGGRALERHGDGLARPATGQRGAQAVADGAVVRDQRLPTDGRDPVAHPQAGLLRRRGGLRQRIRRRDRPIRGQQHTQVGAGLPLDGQPGIGQQQPGHDDQRQHDQHAAGDRTRPPPRDRPRCLRQCGQRPSLPPVHPAAASGGLPVNPAPF